MAIKEAFALSWEEQLDFLAKIESRAKNPTVVPISKVLVELFTPAPTIDIKKELKQLEDTLTQEIDTLAAKIPKEIVGKEGKRGIQGTSGLDGVGLEGKAGKSGVDGKAGRDGVSIVGVSLDFDNSIVVTLSDGTEIDAGQIELPTELTKVIATIRGSESSNLTRVILVTTSSTTMGDIKLVDYVYFVNGVHTMSLPSPNLNRYTVKNNHSTAIIIDTVGSELIEGATSILVASEASVDILSDGTNWFVV